MKLFMIIAFFSTILTAQAKSFVPMSGMKMTCFDNVANQTYSLKIVDIGDEEAQIIVHEKGRVIARYTQATFKEYDKGSYFVVTENGREMFGIDFPNNDIEAVYYHDGGDSRSIDCKFM
jgi:hypothetical protein